MSPSKWNLPVILACVLVPLLLSGCERTESTGAEESVLRIHDVSGLEIEALDGKLNDLLSRDDLPLRGKVELLDDNRLAVNASRFLQDEIASIIKQLQDSPRLDAVERPFRVEFWLLRMAREPGSDDVPGYLSEELDPLLSQYEGYGLSVHDYLESFHSGVASVDHIASGQLTNIYFESVASTRDRIVMEARVASHRPNGPGAIQYHINHTLQPGRALVLGRAHDGGGAENASYQVLVARAEWAHSTD